MRRGRTLPRSTSRSDVRALAVVRIVPVGFEARCVRGQVLAALVRAVRAAGAGQSRGSARVGVTVDGLATDRLARSRRDPLAPGPPLAIRRRVRARRSVAMPAAHPIQQSGLGSASHRRVIEPSTRGSWPAHRSNVTCGRAGHRPNQRCHGVQWSLGSPQRTGRTDRPDHARAFGTSPGADTDIPAPRLAVVQGSEATAGFARLGLRCQAVVATVTGASPAAPIMCAACRSANAPSGRAGAGTGRRRSPVSIGASRGPCRPAARVRPSAAAARKGFVRAGTRLRRRCASPATCRRRLPCATSSASRRSSPPAPCPFGISTRFATMPPIAGCRIAGVTGLIRPAARKGWRKRATTDLGEPQRRENVLRISFLALRAPPATGTPARSSNAGQRRPVEHRRSLTYVSGAMPRQSGSGRAAYPAACFDHSHGAAAPLGHAACAARPERAGFGAPFAAPLIGRLAAQTRGCAAWSESRSFRSGISFSR